ncbi:heat shock protein sti1 homolog [Solanum pennellii]|uniref:Heat shock protein sti1 homolog n=1 Tax=Solanum pennellii TaxID=28526 RepID=A0ABM1VA58_SOLPN|nr:heat shock protein sti1 homolog [Solanum pennellii]
MESLSLCNLIIGENSRKVQKLGEENYGAILRCLLTRLEDEFKGLKQERVIPKKDLPEVTPEAKKKAADAKAKGDEAFKRNDLPRAINAYTQGAHLCLLVLCMQSILIQLMALCFPIEVFVAKACRELGPDWAKGCYRHGAALRLLQRFEEAANAFYEGVQIDPESKELVTAFREAVEAGREFRGTEQV